LHAIHALDRSLCGGSSSLLSSAEDKPHGSNSL
jgi:hypothetical protein